VPPDPRVSYTATHDLAAANCCDIAAATISALAETLASRQSPYADEFQALADRLVRRGDQLLGEAQPPGTGRSVARLSLVP
jgi:nitrate reductase assembly molybdenum cofactor insertion protein NarJ